MKSMAHASMTVPKNADDECSSASHPSKKRLKGTYGNKVVPCTKCYVGGRICDQGSPCMECFIRNKGTGCKRVMCKNYEKGACRRSKCLFAHEGDGYQYLTAHLKLKPGRLEMAASDVDTDD
jgi:hypothetical protein